MKKIFLLFTAIPLLWAGCSKEDHPVTPEEDIYVFKEIEYFLKENEGDFITEETWEKEIPTVKNASETVTIYVKVDPYEIPETSRFFIDEPIPFQWLEEPEVMMPSSSYREGEKLYNVVNRRALMDFEKVQEMPFFSIGEKEVELKPGGTLDVSYHSTYDNMRVSYTAYFQGVETGEIKTVSGKWEGKSMQLAGQTILTIHPIYEPEVKETVFSSSDTMHEGMVTRSVIE